MLNTAEEVENEERNDEVRVEADTTGNEEQYCHCARTVNTEKYVGLLRAELLENKVNEKCTDRSTDTHRKHKRKLESL